MDKSGIENAIKEYLTELQGYRVSLDADPLSSGLGTFNVKIAQAREFTNRAATILTNSILWKRKAQALRDRRKTEFEMAVARLIASDARIYDVPEGHRASVETRRANATRILRDEGVTVEEDLLDLEDLLQRVQAFNEVAKAVFDNLNETRKDLLYQISVIRTQITVGEVSTDPTIKPDLFSSIEMVEKDIVKGLPLSGEVDF